MNCIKDLFINLFRIRIRTRIRNVISVLDPDPNKSFESLLLLIRFGFRIRNINKQLQIIKESPFMYFDTLK
jgi:hypothetical protein